VKPIMIIVVLVVATSGVAQETPKGIPEQAAPVYAYVKSALTDDLPAFKDAHTKRALDAYEHAGGVGALFERVKSELPRKFRDAKLAEFSFTAKKQTHAVPGGPLELDGEYYMVMMNVEKVGGVGVFVEKEDGHWKITTPRYKNFDELMRKHKAMTDGTSNKPAGGD